MLTKTDLSQIQKSVRKVVREEVQLETNSLRRDLKGEIKLTKIELFNELETLTNRVKNLEIQTNKTGAQVEQTAKDIKAIRKDINMIAGYYDKEVIELKTRIQKVERHLGLPSPAF